MRLVAFCEAAADFQIASDLVDRVLRDHGERWISDLLETAPVGVRSWRGDGGGRPFFVVSALAAYADKLAVRVPHGHFEGQPGAADAMMGRTALAIARKLAKQAEGVDAVLLLRDLDDQPERKAGLGQARAEACSWASFAIVVGGANPKREAWVLCGFEPQDPDEQGRLDELRQELGFHPHLEAHQLSAKDEQAKRSAKRVLRILTDGEGDREQRCWTVTSLDTLRARGVATGLCEFLDEVAQHLLPLVARSQAP